MAMCPRILALQLKRFQYDPATEIFAKRSDLITFSETLDLSCFCSRELKFCSAELAASRPIYRLRSFLNHTGGYGAGHYISYCRTNDEIWYRNLAPAQDACCRLQQDDSRVSNITAVDALHASQRAYVLFFEVSLIDPVAQR